MRRTAFGFGLLVVALAAAVWFLVPQDPVSLGALAGSATALVTLAMLWVRRDSVAFMSGRGAMRWVQVNLVSRLAVLILVLLLLQRQLGTSGDIAFLGGFFVVQAVVLIFLVKGKA